MKLLEVFLAMGLVLGASGCANSNVFDKGSNQPVQVSSNKLDVTNNSSEVTDNPFFFKENVSQVNYTGNVYFNEGNIELHINKLADLKYGKLYELKLDSYEEVPADRLDLGYFYVQKDRIFKIKPTEENLKELKTNEEIPIDSNIVCQDGEQRDTYSEDVKGLHHYILVNGDTREFHSNNNQVETGYYESYIWKKDRGLIKYSSGFGAERDAINMQINND